MKPCTADSTKRVISWAELPLETERAMYGLKPAPALWQQHFCSTMLNLGMRRCKADPKLVLSSLWRLYALCYVDDLLVCGKHELCRAITKGLEKEVLLKLKLN